MKKLLAILLAGLMVFSIVACDNKGNQNNSDDEQYKEVTIVVDSFTDDDGNTFYFEIVDSKTVVVSGFSTTNDKAHDVTIPAYLMVPGNEREQEPDRYLRVVGIGKLAFKTTSSIKTLHFPTEAAYLEYNATFDISQHTFTIAEYAFRDCVALETLSIPAYVTEIGKGAFINCSSLKTITFEEGSRLEEIKDSAFMNCISLQSITTPASIKAIGVGAFFECKSLASVVINEGTLFIGDQAFQKCTALASVKLPASLGIYKDSEFIASRYPDAKPAPIGEAAFGLCDGLYDEDDWTYAGVAPVEPEPAEGVDKNSDEYKESAEYKAYEEALAAYNAIIAYKNTLALKAVSKAD